MSVLAFLIGMFAVLAPAAWIADHWPTAERRSVARHERQMRALGKRTP